MVTRILFNGMLQNCFGIIFEGFGLFREILDPVLDFFENFSIYLRNRLDFWIRIG